MVAVELQVMATQTETNPPSLTTNNIEQQPHHNNHHGGNNEPNNTNTSNNNNNNNNNNSNSNSNYVFANLGRQSSIYSLTLDEFQHTLSENGKNFGSMNMDEFLNSIWTAEENQAHHSNHNHNHNTNNNVDNLHLPSINVASSDITSTNARRRTSSTLVKQPSLARQGSLTLPAPLCRKTVDEVWTEIQRRQPGDEPEPEQQQPVGDAQRQSTFGEMTLEDFLIKAGVVREQSGPAPPTPLVAVPVPPPPPPLAHRPYGFSTSQMGGPSFVTRPMMGVAPGGAYQGLPQSGGESSGYTGNGKRSNGYPGPVVGPPANCFGGRGNNGGAPGGGGFGPGPGPGAGMSPVSPVSPEGLCGSGQVDNTGGQYGLDMASLRGRKRIIDGPVEKVVERRQRRMIKNRESAARSRARKQAYTVELEAELNQLREENAQLKQALEEIERQRKQQYHEKQNIKVVLSRAQRAQDKLRAMRRSRSCTL